MEKQSYLKSINAEYIDELFERYRDNPDSVDSSWRYFFEGIDLGTEFQPSQTVIPSPSPARQDSLDSDSSEAKVANLIDGYRMYGHLLADLDPLSLPISTHPLLEVSFFGLNSGDLPKTFKAGKLIGMGPATLNSIIARLKKIYCNKIGIEYLHIKDTEQQQWLQKYLEGAADEIALDPETRKYILIRLTESESFERFLHSHYVAQKRFSLEGGESTISALDCIMETAVEAGAQQFVIGMAHRGRLNVLTHVVGKRAEDIFSEFGGSSKTVFPGEGDVKYHLGYSSERTTRSGKPFHVTLAFNPSHLEFINPVIEGMARAKQTLYNDWDHSAIIPIVIHGDAAFAGQGVSYETMNLSLLEGYKTGGTLHVLINNKIGFTTLPHDSRSTTYATDGAKILEVPIFHVNGDDPEAVWFVTRLATEYRQKFKQDVFIDLICYRKYGHNEGDEPMFTQPLLYKQIKDHPSVRESYTRKLEGLAVITPTASKTQVDKILARLNEEYSRARTDCEAPHPPISVFQDNWRKFRAAHSEKELFESIDTAVDERTLLSIAEQINHVPPSFQLNPKLNRFFDSRLKAVKTGEGIDWGNGEVLAFATLLNEGTPIRLSGQDAGRGTFTHRHAILHDFETGDTYTPLHNVHDGQASFTVYNSPLSEAAVMGFEYGYSITDPHTLVLWEAQFGDFANGAQVIIDQFISASESKWQRHTGLVLLLPHGYEGQGPEHSSAKLERFLQLCGKFNLCVTYPTTPAQLFHLLRRQIKRPFRKPLIIMSPKSLLRHPQAISKLMDFTKGSFKEILADSPEFNGAEKVLLCTGKIYYDLLAARTAQASAAGGAAINLPAILRIEQLYPWPTEQIKTLFNTYTNAKDWVWVQEEPQNMGAWTYVYSLWHEPIRYVGREPGAAPASGSAKTHEKEQKALVAQAFAEDDHQHKRGNA